MPKYFRMELGLRLAETPFNLYEACKLSNRIHQAKVDGYELSPAEERLWHELTLKMQAAIDNHV